MPPSDQKWLIKPQASDAMFFAGSRPNSDIEPISESASYWGTSCRCHQGTAHHSKRSFRSFALLGWNYSRPEILCGRAP